MESALESPSYVERRLRELGVERREPSHDAISTGCQSRPGRVLPSARPAPKAIPGASEAVRGADGLLWRQQDLALVEQLVAERRNVLLCGGGGTGKSTLAAVLAGSCAVARPGEAVHCVLEHYDSRVLEGAAGIVTDPGGLELRAALRRGVMPACGSLVFDEIYTSSGAHSLLAAWRQGITGIGTLVVSEPAQGDCLGRLALLEQSHPDGFSETEVVRIYRAARPVMLRTVYPGLIECLGEPLAAPSWMEA
jgi:hypothetical protein